MGNLRAPGEVSKRGSRSLESEEQLVIPLTDSSKETPVHDVKAAYRTRAQIEKFSGNLSHGLPKVGRRVVRKVLYGVQARGSVKLSEIARSLGEPTRPALELRLVTQSGADDVGLGVLLLVGGLAQRANLGVVEGERLAKEAPLVMVALPSRGPMVGGRQRLDVSVIGGHPIRRVVSAPAGWR